MKSVRHISFDVWNTLISPNPEFAKARLRLLAAEISVPADTLERVYREIKDGADDMAETSGEALRSAEVYDRLMARLDRPDFNWWSLRQGFEHLFMKYPPKVLEENVDLLRRLQVAKFGLSFASNTNIIRGSALHDCVLGTWGVDWDFQVFSDEIGKAKPHPFFWKVVSERALAHTGAYPTEVLHVGDNKICDGGCVDAYFQFAHVNGPGDLARTLEKINEQAEAA